MQHQESIESTECVAEIVGPLPSVTGNKSDHSSQDSPSFPETVLVHACCSRVPSKLHLLLSNFTQFE